MESERREGERKIEHAFRRDCDARLIYFFAMSDERNDFGALQKKIEIEAGVVCETKFLC